MSLLNTCIICRSLRGWERASTKLDELFKPLELVDVGHLDVNSVPVVKVLVVAANKLGLADSE